MFLDFWKCFGFLEVGLVSERSLDSLKSIWRFFFVLWNFFGFLEVLHTSAFTVRFNVCGQPLNHT